MTNKRLLALYGVLIMVLSVFGGCSRNNIANEVAALNTSNIRRVANLFAACQSVNGGKGPKDTDAMKNLANQLPTENLQWMGIDKGKLDALFISERDGKPFKIKFGAFRSIMAPHIPVVFESQGVDGKRQVAWTSAQVRDVDDAEYQQLWGEKAPAPSGPPGGENTGSGAAKQSSAK